MVIYTTFNIVNIWKMWEKKGKIRRTRSMTKKRSSEIFTLKMEICPEIGPRKNFLPPPNSARGLRPCKIVSVSKPVIGDVFMVPSHVQHFCIKTRWKKYLVQAFLLQLAASIPLQSIF